jgi:putative DNA primase/helicase
MASGPTEDDRGGVEEILPEDVGLQLRDETYAQIPKGANKVLREVGQTDIGNARRLAAAFGDRVRFWDNEGLWYLWDGTRWFGTKSTVQLERLAKTTVARTFEIALSMQGEARKALLKHCTASARASQITSMIKLARSENPILLASPQSPFDRNPWLLNVRNGVINLEKGQLDDHSRRHWLSKKIPINYLPSAKSPLWDKYLTEVFDDDQLIGFIQRAVGYTISGSVAEHCLFLCYGEGRNGKSVFLNILNLILGKSAGYAITADFSTFTSSTKEYRNRDDLYDLCGKRFVSARETQRGVRLNEAIVKNLTGGDPIRAAAKYQRPIEFDPTHKVWLAVNHLPSVHDDSVAFWERIHVIPFLKRFSKKEQDRGLEQALAQEAEGVLRWAVEGCMKWIKEGLTPPASVGMATAEYRESRNPVHTFLRECCEEGAFQERLEVLFEAFETWCDERREDRVSRPAFVKTLESTGCAKELPTGGKDRFKTVLSGLRLVNGRDGGGLRSV